MYDTFLVLKSDDLSFPLLTSLREKMNCRCIHSEQQAYCGEAIFEDGCFAAAHQAVAKACKSHQVVVVVVVVVVEAGGVGIGMVGQAALVLPTNALSCIRTHAHTHTGGGVHHHGTSEKVRQNKDKQIHGTAPRGPAGMRYRYVVCLSLF